MQKISSFEEACEKKGISTQLPDVSSWPAALRRPMIALYKLTVIRDAIVGEWIPDWNDEDQRKWYPWFYMNKPGFRFHVVRYTYTYTHTGLGSQLVFATEEQANYAGQTFVKLYEEMMTLMSWDSSAELGSAAYVAVKTEKAIGDLENKMIRAQYSNMMLEAENAHLRRKLGIYRCVAHKPEDLALFAAEIQKSVPLEWEP
jgi:hypothetical protein